jgi:hypothetical protein
MEEMGWAWHVAYIGEIINAYGILTRNLEGERKFEGRMRSC